LWAQNDNFAAVRASPQRTHVVQIQKQFTFEYRAFAGLVTRHGAAHRAGAAGTLKPARGPKAGVARVFTYNQWLCRNS